MDPTPNGCCLCLDPFAECYTTIENPQLQVQMEKVFCFPIETKQGYCSGVCQSCSYVISEFYQYSEKVRQNQEVLYGNVTTCDPTADSKTTLKTLKAETFSDSELPETIEDASEAQDEILGGGEVPTADSKITLERVKVEMLSDSGLPETTEDAYEHTNEVSEEEEGPNSGDDESYEPPPKKSQAKRKGHPGKINLDNLEADEQSKTSKQTTLIRKHVFEQRIEEDQLFNKHFRMICDLCETSAATFTELRSHFRNEHNGRDGYLVCCKNKLFKRYQILDHIDYHANPDVFRCKVCGNKYKKKYSLNEHMLFKHPSTGPFKCDLCPQSFAQKSDLAKHMKWHMKLKCPRCDKIFTSKHYLSHHMTNKHSGKMVCDICGEEFLSKQRFDRHKQEHMGIEVQRFQCELCQRWLKSKQSLRNHMITVHTDGDREVQCDICQQKCSHSLALAMHKYRTHAKPKHECEFCGKKFKVAIALKEHRATHTEEILYTCEYCGIPNNCKSHLYQHIKWQHPTEWAQKKLKATQSSGSF